MTIYFCKQCGRTGRFNEKPNHCYFCHIDHIENVSDEDAVRMGVNIPDGSPYEFPGDVRWDPKTGIPMLTMTFERFDVGMKHLQDGNPISGRTLKDFQRDVMERVL